jgi:hypothetical protein
MVMRGGGIDRGVDLDDDDDDDSNVELEGFNELIPPEARCAEFKDGNEGT